MPLNLKELTDIYNKLEFELGTHSKPFVTVGRKGKSVKIHSFSSYEEKVAEAINYAESTIRSLTAYLLDTYDEIALPRDKDTTKADIAAYRKQQRMIRDILL